MNFRRDLKVPGYCRLGVWGNAFAVTVISFDPGPAPAEVESHPVLDEAASQLTAYFAGTLTEFRLPLEPQGTPFQRSVWQELLTIPFGETRSYSQIAQAIGQPQAVRAVGAANGRNPIPLVIPCHRVIGANGKLTGFGGGLPLKRLLLDLENPQRALTSR